LTAAERARPLLQPDQRDAALKDGVIDLIADDAFAPAGARSGSYSPTSSRPSTSADGARAWPGRQPRLRPRRRGRLPLLDRSFDAVRCFAASHMFTDPFSALDHISAARPFAYIWADHTGAGCGLDGGQ
jgi:hypothetical protein